jgi:hypothetical protein
LALAWTGAGECPARNVVLERIFAQGVAARIGDWVPERHAKAKLAVEVEVVGEGPRFRADLRLRDADGESTRSFSAASCDALADATALIVAVTLDPVGVANLHAGIERPESEPEPEPEPEPRPKPEPPPLDEPPPIDLTLSASDETEPSSWPDELRVGVSIHAGGGWGPVAAFSGALGGRLALLGPRWRVEAGGRWATPRRIEADGAAGVFDAWLFEARGCFAAKLRRLDFPLCPGVEIGSVRGRGVPPTLTSTRRGFAWVAPSLSQGLNWAPVERFAIGVELGLVVPVTRGRFVVDESTIGGLALVGGRALAILELRLP